MNGLIRFVSNQRLRYYAWRARLEDCAMFLTTVWELRRNIVELQSRIREKDGVIAHQQWELQTLRRGQQVAAMMRAHR